MPRPGSCWPRPGKNAGWRSFEETAGESKVSRAFQLNPASASWTILVRDEVRAPKAGRSPDAAAAASAPPAAASAAAALSPGIELLLDVELEATLRFGCREMPLGEILDLGPGDVVQLDRHVSDPVDLIVGDKIVARGEVVLVNGNFGLRVTEVAAPRSGWRAYDASSEPQSGTTRQADRPRRWDRPGGSGAEALRRVAAERPAAALQDGAAGTL